MTFPHIPITYLQSITKVPHCFILSCFLISFPFFILTVTVHPPPTFSSFFFLPLLSVYLPYLSVSPLFNHLFFSLLYFTFHFCLLFTPLTSSCYYCLHLLFISLHSLPFSHHLFIYFLRFYFITSSPYQPSPFLHHLIYSFPYTVIPASSHLSVPYVASSASLSAPFLILYLPPPSSYHLSSHFVYSFIYISPGPFPPSPHLSVCQPFVPTLRTDAHGPPPSVRPRMGLSSA